MSVKQTVNNDTDISLVKDETLWVLNIFIIFYLNYFVLMGTLCFFGSWNGIKKRFDPSDWAAEIMESGLISEMMSPLIHYLIGINMIYYCTI